MVNEQSLRDVAAILRERAYGPGLSIRELRQAYPTQVRRITILESLRHLEELGLVRWKHNRIWWLGPIPEEAHPLGLRSARLRSSEKRTPPQRVAVWLETRRNLRVAPPEGQ